MINLKPWGKIHVSLLFLIWSYSLVLSNYHFNVLLSSWGSYCWGVGCGRIASPCPHAHSTSGLFHFTWARKIGTMGILRFSSILMQRDCGSPFSSRTGGDSSMFSSHKEPGELFSIIHNFPVNELFTFQGVYVFSSSICGSMYMLPCSA